MNQPKFENLYIPNYFTRIDTRHHNCMHPLTNTFSDSKFFKISGCGQYEDEKWTCKQCLANLSNIEIAKKYFRLKKLKEVKEVKEVKND